MRSITHVHQRIIFLALSMITISTSAFAQTASKTFLEENRLAIAIMVVIYIFPSLVAHWRHHPSKISIIIVNLVFGATGIGWIVALIWACGKINQPVVIVSANTATSVIPTTQNAPAASVVASKSIVEKIADLKSMVDTGTITQAEFELLKADAIKNIS